MVEQAGGYYGEPFHGKRGLIQDDPFTSAIFNVVVDAVVCHWKSLVEEREEGDSSNTKGDVAVGDTSKADGEGEILLYQRWYGGIHISGVASVGV